MDTFFFSSVTPKKSMTNFTGNYSVPTWNSYCVPCLYSVWNVLSLVANEITALSCRVFRVCVCVCSVCLAGRMLASFVHRMYHDEPSFNSWMLFAVLGGNYYVYCCMFYFIAPFLHFFVPPFNLIIYYFFASSTVCCR